MASSPIGSTVRTIWDDKNVENIIIIQIWDLKNEHHPNERCADKEANLTINNTKQIYFVR